MNRTARFFHLPSLVLPCLLAACLEPDPQSDADTAADAIGTSEQCDTTPADKFVAWGDPHIYLDSASYSNPGCSGAYVVDEWYHDLGALPGTYLSWADQEPTSEAECAVSKLTVYVWDVTSSPKLYKGMLTSQGVWVDNPDPSRNPGSTKVCQINPIRVEDSLSLTPSKKYRFALRASRMLHGVTSNRRLVFANAPLPGRAGPGGAGSSAAGWYMTMLSSSGADMNGKYPWPTSTFQLRFSAMNARVTTGGDLVYQEGVLFNPSHTFTRLDHPNFARANGGIVVVYGGSPGLNEFSCPPLTMDPGENFPPTYSYPAWYTGSTANVGSTLCVAAARSQHIWRVKVLRTDAAKGLVLLGYNSERSTGRVSYGCLDGVCDSQVQVAAQFMRRGTKHQTMLATTFDLLHQARACIEDHLQRTLPVPLTMELHGEAPNEPFPNGGFAIGEASNRVFAWGFQGIIRPGEKQVEFEEDLRFELHEPMHVFNYHFFDGSRPDWFEEGMAIQLGVRLDCGDHPRLMKDIWRGWPDFQSPHAKGSELFRRLEQDHGCDVDCAADIWRTLVDNHATDPEITPSEIMAVMEARIGQNLGALFMDLGLFL